MEIQLISLAVLISAILAIVFRQKNDTNMYAIFKALTTILIIAIGFIIYNDTSSDYSAIIILALLFSLIGDVLLVKEEYFLHGLIAFLIAHICFIFGFTTIHGFDWNIIPLIPLLVVAGVYYSFLRKDLKKYSIPVMIYMTVIVLMTWQAIGLVVRDGNYVFLAIAIGSVLFSVSDAILAYNKFKKSFKLAGILILTTYWISIFVFTIAGHYISA